MPDILILVATFWERVQSKHDLLPRLLESIRSMNEEGFRVIVVNSTFDRKHHEMAVEKIDNNIRPFKKDFRVSQLTYADLDKVHKFLESNGFGDIKHGLAFGNFSCFRNVGLVAAALTGSKVVVFLDDDEVIADKDFLKKAREFISKTRMGEFVGAVAGFYLNRDGSYLLQWKFKDLWWDIFWNKVKHLNQAFKSVAGKPRPSKTTFAFGGNLVLHERLFKQLPFDPMIPYGEDIDLLISAKSLGFEFFFDKERTINHFPNKRTLADWCRYMRSDAYRFIYERKKILHLIKEKKLPATMVEDLDPYPGSFLRKTIYLKLVLTSLMLLAGSIVRLKSGEAKKHLANIRIALFDARQYAEKNKSSYGQFQKRWTVFIKAIAKDSSLPKHFQKKFS